MSTSTAYYEDFEIEIAKSEYQRARLLVLVFSIGLSLATVNYFIVDIKVLSIYGGAPSYFFIVSWLAVFVVYAMLVAKSIKYRIDRKMRVTTFFKVAQTIIEVSYVSILIFYRVDVHDSLLFIDSPVPFLYFIFIILSILHLDFKFNLLSAVLAAVQFAFIVYYGYRHAGISIADYPNLPENGFYLRCFLFILAGGAAGFVSEEVKRRVKSSLESKNQTQKIEFLIGQQLSKEVYSTLTENGGEVRKLEATVMALDIRDFSSFAENRSLDEILDFQNKIFSPILEIVAQHQGVVNQILGDGVMATFGTPRPNPLHADMAFQAAIKIIEKVKELSNNGTIPHTRIGVGIHTGEVITGNIGNETRRQYSISGTAVIIAFRVEQLNKDLGSELLITEEVKKKVIPGKTNISYLGSKTLKGFGRNVEVYKVDA